MSWAKDEWKDGLSVNALKHVNELEQQNERIVKDNKQKQFQIDSQTAAFQKQKRLTEEEKSKNAALKRENQSLTETCNEVERTKQKLQHDIQQKDGRISCIEGQLSRLKQTLDHEISKHSQVKADLEKEQFDHSQSLKKIEKQSTDYSKLQEHSSFMKRQLEGQKEKIKSLETQLKTYGDFDIRSRSSSQSSCDSIYDDGNDKYLQTKLEEEVQLRKKIEGELKRLQELQSLNVKEAENAVKQEAMECTPSLEEPICKGMDSQNQKEQLTELKSCVANLELQLQASKKELTNKTELLKEKEIQLCEVKQNFDDNLKQNGRAAEDLLKTKSDLDQAKSQIENLERKSKTFAQELECQRHNSEAVIKGLEERMKEKGKQHREELSTQSQALTALDKDHRDLMNKMKQEQQLAQAAQRELQGKLDQKIQEAEKIKRHMDDMKLDGSNKDHAMKSKEQTITELSQEIKTLKQEKNTLLSDLDREASSKKKLEDQLKAAKNEVVFKNDLIKSTEEKATAQVKELEKVKQQVLCDLENARTVQFKLEHDNEELKKAVNVTTSSKEKIEHEMELLKKKLDASEKDVQRLNHETQHLNANINEQKKQHMQLETKLKEANHLNSGKDNEAKTMVDKVSELENKCWSLQQEIDTKSRELEESKRCHFELQTKQENIKKIMEAKDMEVNAMKNAVTEVEAKQSLANDKKFNELERFMEMEKQNNILLQEECAKLKRELNETKQIENELRYKLQEISSALKENQECVAKKEREFEDERNNRKNTIHELEKKLDVLKKEKEQEKQDMSNSIHQRNDEICEILDELKKKTGDVVKLRETEINLQNLLTARDTEKSKLEESNKELAEKSQKREEELLLSIEQLQNEKTSLNEKERNLITVNDTLKRDIKALQNDYRKACILSDEKSEELKELIDKYGVSQKEVQHFQNRMINAEKSLKECEQKLRDTHQEKENIVQELALKEESLETVRKEISILNAENEAQIAGAQENHKEVKEKLNREVTEKEMALKEAQSLADKMNELEIALQNSNSQLAILNEKSENHNELIQKKNLEIEGLVRDLKSTETQLQDIEQKLNKEGNSSNELEQRCRQLELQVEEMLAVIKTKEDESTTYANELKNLQNVSDKEMFSLRQQVVSLEKEISELQQNISQSQDALMAKENEVHSIKADLLKSHDSLIDAQNELESKTREVSDLSSMKSNLEVKLSDAIVVLKEKELLVESQSKELKELQTKFDSKLANVDAESRSNKEEVEMLHSKQQQLKQSLEFSEIKLNEACEELNAKHMELMEASKEVQKFKSHFEEIGKREADLLEQKHNLSISLDITTKELEAVREKLQEQQNIADSCASDKLSKESKLKQKLDELANELARVNSCLEKKEEELNTALNKALEMENECSGLNAMMDASAEIAMNLEDENSKLKESKEHLVVSLEERNRELIELKEKQKQMEIEWTNSVENYTTQIEKTSEDVNVLQSKLSQAEEIDKLKSNEIKSLKENIDCNGGVKENLVSKIKSLQESCASLLEENSNIKQKVQHFTEITLSKDKEITTKSKEIEGLKLEFDSKMLEWSAEVAGLKEENSVLRNQAAQHDELVTSKNTSVKELHSKFEVLVKESNELKTILEEKTSALERAENELKSYIGKTEILENLLNTKNHEMSLRSEELLQCTNVQQVEFLEKCELLNTTADQLHITLSEKEQLTHLLEAKEKDLLKWSQRYEENNKEKEEAILKLCALQDSLNVKNEEVRNLFDRNNQLEGMVSNLKTEKELITNQECSFRMEANEEVASLKVKLHEFEEKVDTLNSAKEKLEDAISHKETEVQKMKDLSLQLQKDVEGLAAQKEILQMDFEDKDDVIDSLHKQITQQEQLVNELKSKSQEKEEKYNTVVQDMETMRSQIDVTQMDIEDKEDLIEELKTKIRALESQVNSLKKSNHALEDDIKQSKAALMEMQNFLDEKEIKLKTVESESGVSQLKSGDLIKNLQITISVLGKEKSELESRVYESESLVETLKQQIIDFQQFINTQQVEKQTIETTLSSKVNTLEQTKKTLEQRVKELENQMAVSSEALDTYKIQLAALETNVETERTNLFKSKQEFLSKKELLEGELRVTHEKLQECEEALENAKSDLSNAFEGKDVAESMLVVVDGNLQNCKQQLIENEKQVTVLEHSLAEKQDEIVNLKEISTRHQEELENLKQGLNADQQVKEKQIQEMCDKIKNVENLKEIEIESLKNEHRTEMEEIQKGYELSIENAKHHKTKIMELEGSLGVQKQEIAELHQVIESHLEDIQAKTLEKENLQSENKMLLSSRETLQRDLGFEIERLKDEMKEKEDECRQVQVKLSDQEMISSNKQQEYLVELSSVRQENDALQTQLKSLLSKMQGVESELQAGRRRVEELENLLQESRENNCSQNLILNENLKELEKNKIEAEQKYQEERDLLVTQFRTKENELTEALHFHKEQNCVLNEEMDKLNNQITNLKQSNERLTKVNDGNFLDIKAQLEDTEQKLKLSYARVEELLEEKRLSYDAMQLAERQTYQTRVELEHEITSAKESLRKVTQEAENYQHQLEILQEQKSSIERKFNDMKSNALMFEQNAKESDLDYQAKIAELNSSLESAQTQLTKVIAEKNEVSSLLDRSKSELEQVFESLARFETEKGSNEAMINQTRELRDSIDVLQNEVDDLKTAKAELHSQLMNEKQTVSNLKAELDTLGNDVCVTESRHKTESTELKQTLERLESENAELSEKIVMVTESSQQELRARNLCLEEMTNENASLSAKLKEKASCVTDLEASNDELLQVNEKLCETIEKLKEAIEQKKSELTNLRGTTDSVNRDYEDAVQELQNLRQESAEDLEKRDEKMSEMTHRINNLQHSQEELTVEKNKLLQEKEDLVDQIALVKQANEEFQGTSNQLELETQELRKIIEEKASTILELTNSTKPLQQALEAKHKEMEEMKSFFESTNEDLDMVCEQRAEEIQKLKKTLSEKMQEANMLELKLQDKDDEIKHLRERFDEIIEQLDNLKEMHAKQCKDYDERIYSLQQDLNQAQHDVQREKTNMEASLNSFEERERQWEGERKKLVNSMMDQDKVRQSETSLLADLSRAENEIKELQNTLALKDQELEKEQKKSNQTTSAFDDAKAQFKRRIEKLEQECEELKYISKQKEDEFFVYKEKIIEYEARIESLEKKELSSEEIELELRHHLGEVTQQLESLRESTTSETTNNADINQALQTISDLKEEINTKESQFEEEKTQIVEAAKTFALEREEDFEQKMSTKDDQIETLENELNQLKHDLRVAQDSQKALLEAADEREKDFESVKMELQDEGAVQGKLADLSLKLKQEQQKCQLLEENAKKLQLLIDNVESAKASLQRQVDGLQREIDSEKERFQSEETSLTEEVFKLRDELKQAQQCLKEEFTRVKELSKENSKLNQTLKILEEETQRERKYSSETEEECRVLKEQLNGLKSAQSEAKIEKEQFIVNESNEKVKLKEFECKIKRLKEEIEDKAKKYESDVAAIQKENCSLEEQKTGLEKSTQNMKQNCEELEKNLKEIKAENLKNTRKLKNAEEEIANLKHHNLEEVEFTKTQLVLAEYKCSNLSEELSKLKESESKKFTSMQDDLTKRSAKLQARVLELETESNVTIPQLHAKISKLEAENKSLRMKIEGKLEIGNDIKEQIKELEERLCKEENRISEKERQVKEKEVECNALVEKNNALERQNLSLQNKNLSLQNRLQIATDKMKNDKKAVVIEEPVLCPENTVALTTQPKTGGMFSPLARSMSELGITTTVTETRSHVEPTRSLRPPCQTTTTTKMPLPSRGDNKRAREPETETAPKRSRLTSEGDSVAGPSEGSPELPEGLPDVVRKGFNDIPNVPITSPFILRRTTAQVSKTKSGLPRKVQSRAARSTHIPKPQTRNATKENPDASPPRGLARPQPSTVLSPRKTNIPTRGPECSLPSKKSKIPNIARHPQQSRPAISKGKQIGPTTRSSHKHSMQLNKLQDSPKSHPDEETCAMQ